MGNALTRSHIRLAGALVALLVLLGAAAALASGAQSAHQARAALTLASRHPATVQGTGFEPRARVRVALVESVTLVRRPLTNARGVFTATFSAGIDRCSAWSITALQPGRAPVVLRGAQPECAPASTP
jgi:hypothetical protein